MRFYQNVILLIFIAIQKHFISTSRVRSIYSSKIIISNDRHLELQNTLVGDELCLNFLGISFVLQMLAEVEVFGLDNHLLVVEVYLNVFHR